MEIINKNREIEKNWEISKIHCILSAGRNSFDVRKIVQIVLLNLGQNIRFSQNISQSLCAKSNVSYALLIFNLENYVTAQLCNGSI